MTFRSSIVRGVTLVREAIRSQNYVANTSGWTINADGTSEFSDTVIRGSFEVDFPGGGGAFIGPNEGIVIFNAADDDVVQLHLNSFDDTVGEISSNTLTLFDAGGLDQIELLNAGNNTCFAAIIDPTDITVFHFRGTTGGLHLESNTVADDVDFQNNGSRIAQANLVQNYAPNISASQALTSVLVDLAGVTQTFTTLYNNAQVIVHATIDNTVTAAIGAGGVTAGSLMVDGVAQTRQIIGDAATINRGHVSQQWLVTLATAGSHTIKLQARKTINAGTVTANALHTGMTLTVFDFYS